ncbi:MAG: hypothetical protein M3083_11875 [Actinomycetota bacterium]|nr:hypothetical protein [Actinomycetota bacterium]
MTANRSDVQSHQVMVVLGQPDHALIARLHAVGLAPIAEDGEVVIWGRRLACPHATATAGATGDQTSRTPHDHR